MLSTREIINYFDTLEAYEKFALEWAEVLKVFGVKPLLGDKRGKTRWLCFMKD